MHSRNLISDYMCIDISDTCKHMSICVSHCIYVYTYICSLSALLDCKIGVTQNFFNTLHSSSVYQKLWLPSGASKSCLHSSFHQKLCLLSGCPVFFPRQYFIHLPTIWWHQFTKSSACPKVVQHLTCIQLFIKGSGLSSCCSFFFPPMLYYSFYYLDDSVAFSSLYLNF